MSKHYFGEEPTIFKTSTNANDSKNIFKNQGVNKVKRSLKQGQKVVHMNVS